MKLKTHFYDFNKAFKQGTSTWIPAACGTRVCVGWYQHAKMPDDPVTCRRCLAARKKKGGKR